MHHLDLEKYLLLGKGEKRNGARGRDSILADLFEALIGAIFLDGGLDAAKNFLFNIFSNNIHSILEKPLSNWKALLQDHCQKNFHTTPVYKIVEETGPDHNKIFTVSVAVNDEEIGQGCGPSKKEAQQAAAEIAVRHYNLPSTPPPEN
jgi:ribonuclease-3